MLLPSSSSLCRAGDPLAMLLWAGKSSAESSGKEKASVRQVSSHPLAPLLMCKEENPLRRQGPALPTAIACFFQIQSLPGGSQQST